MAPRPKRSDKRSKPWPGPPSGYRGPPIPICDHGADPDIPVSIRNMREAAAALRKAADFLDLAAARAEALDEASGPGDRSHPRPLPR